MRCLWCANPESQLPTPQVAHRASACVGCGNCQKACPENAVCLVPADGKMTVNIDRQKCVNCGACVEACAAGAIKFYGKDMTVDEVFDGILKDMGYYTRSSGGVTCSGGEPLSQADFVAELFRRCRALGINTAVETSGYGAVSTLDKMLEYTDLVLFDIKLMDREKHRQYTGVDNDVILQNVRHVAKKGVRMCIRIPVIPGVNDSEENLVETARFVAELGAKPPVDLLPYHNFGENKYAMLGCGYALKGMKPPDDATMQRCREVFLHFGLECTIH